ncbi:MULTISPECIES: hypothetical protein [Halolamina]|uniref:Uncharacterized protein n=1 Tax=Halolamina pelagica TaxID=699431 RepID=A0A1I5SBS2_9EURY|nr:MULTISPECIES: hypothetical protein [Halolamina]NHX37133.1 hypothetical protein [Halolamina sp. R1-12]SFP68142.1 hypothetical protein SAMN05216277_10643 [Halolamina pelagica]
MNDAVERPSEGELASLKRMVFAAQLTVFAVVLLFVTGDAPVSTVGSLVLVVLSLGWSLAELRG